MLEVLLAGIMLVALTLYVVTGGADYGAGVLMTAARGPRAQEQSALIDRAIAPIWEANHVWLILIVTVLFTAFPRAFALISTRLHIPLTLLLIGIVLRGSAFAFRTNDVALQGPGDAAQRWWRLVFAGSSLFTPVMLGIVIGAIASGRLALPTDSFAETFLRPWLSPFPLMVGLLALAMFAYLAAVYLVVEAESSLLKGDFRRRALWTWALFMALTAAALSLSRSGAPEIYSGLAHTTPGRLLVAGTALVGLLSVAMIVKRRDRAARMLSVFQVTGVVWGWALAQYPYLVEPSLTLYDAAPSSTLRVLLASLLIGALLLFPSLYLLYRLFKSRVL